MSTAIMRVQKIGGASDVAGSQIHNRREREHSNTNPDIDRQRSKNNYALVQSAKSFNQLIDQRLKDGYKGSRAIRKDAVRMCEALFTSDNDFFNSLSAVEQKEFFTSCYEWACQRWGAVNIISAVVHLDERTPHMHLDFVPLTEDGRLSAKVVLGGRKELQMLQDDFFERVGKSYGLERGSREDIEAGEYGRCHLTSKQAKERERQELDKKIEREKKALGKLQSKVFETEEEIREIDKNARKSFTGGLKGVKLTEWQKMCNTASYVEKERKRRQKAEKDIEKLKAENAELKKQLERKESEIVRTKINIKSRVQSREREKDNEIAELRDTLDFYRKAIKPEFVDKIEAAYRQSQQRKKGLSR